MLMIFLWSLLLGTIAGFLAGLFGLGGGAVIVPILAWLFTLNGFDVNSLMLMAVATSLSTMLLTSVSSVWAHHRLGAVVWSIVWRLMPGIFIGAVSGAMVAEQLPALIIRWIFIAYLLYIALHMALPKKTRAAHSQSTWLDIPVSLLIGLLSAIIGIGGGTMTVPYLVKRGLEMKNAVAVSAVCGLPIALAGSLSYGWLGWQQTNLPEYSAGYVYLPAFAGIALCSILTAPLGARLANRLPTSQLKRAFSLVLILLALKMIWL